MFDILYAHGVRDAVCSPGSRNKPLLLEAHGNADLRTHVIIDERAAGFYALGLAFTSRRPVALVCTSGSAVLNYGPAVAEAYYRQVPLIVVSADRPDEWIDQDDSQTIRQYESLACVVKKSYDVALRDSGTTFFNRILNDAMITALTGVPGPVHINVRVSAADLARECAPAGSGRVIEAVVPRETLPPHRVREMAEELKGRRILLVAGFMAPDARLNEAVEAFTSLPNVYLMAETLSNLHVAGEPWHIDSLLATMSPERKEELKPDLVITIGGALVSRHLKEYIRSYPPREHWTIGEQRTTVDCFLALTRRIETPPARLLAKLARALAKERSGLPRYADEWEAQKRVAMRHRDEFLQGLPWSEMAAHDMLLSALPADFNLHLSNGTPVRYAQLLMRRMPHACYCNRGVSGIDGCTSTAIGSCEAYARPTLLVSGDMSASYDVGALAIRGIPDRFRMAVVNNSGGGIFRFIPNTSGLDCREELFSVAPQLPLEDLARGYGFRYFRAESASELAQLLPDFLGGSGKAILEIVAPPLPSADILKAYFRAP